MLMTTKRLDALNKYVQQLASLMNLSHFSIKVSPKYTDTVDGTEVFATTTIRPDGFTATITFAEAFFDESPESQRQLVCHELIHPHTEAFYLYCFGNETVKQSLGKQTFSVFEESGRSLMERTVDQLAHGWAMSLPLPPKFPK